MLRYIREYPVTVPRLRQQSAAKLREIQEQYLGKRVVSEGLKLSGVVKVVYPKKLGLGAWEFMAEVMWDDRRPVSVVGLRHLVVLQTK